MHIEQLANELVLDIFQYCTSVTDVRNLASTCHHFHKVFISRRLPILFQAAEAQIGPLSDAIQLVTHNASQPVHIPRPSPPLSIALLTSLLTVGQVANKWAAIYPTRKWRGQESDSRRLLSSTECYRLRRALYRHWLYTLAFHDPLHPRTTRHSPPIIRSRAALFRPWPTSQLAELLDLHAIFRDVLTSQICPSNGTVLRRHRARYPDEPAPTLIHARLSSLHHSHHREQQHQQGENGLHSPRQTPLWSPEHFYSSPYKHTRLDHDDDDAAESWGDEIAQYYIIEDMLKLNPDQLLQLYEHVVTTGGRRRGVVERFVAGFVLGGSCCVVGSEGWFENNGETLVETVDLVVGSRGECAVWLKEEVKVGGAEGIVRE